MHPLRVILVDDSQFFLQAAMAFLCDRPGLQLCAHTLLSNDAVTLAALHHADLVLLDLSMPRPNGIEVTRLLKELPNPPRVVIVSLHDKPAYREVARAAGADGFIGKASFVISLLPLLAALFPDRAPFGHDPAPSPLPSPIDSTSPTP